MTNQPVDIVWLGRERCRDCMMMGGKGSALCHLAPLHRVPPLFCVTAAAFARWSVQAETAGGRLPAQLHARLAQVYGEMADLTGRDDPTVAVRSSAVDEDGHLASFAGQHQTFLNVAGVDTVGRAIADCWASLRSARALAYRNQRGLAADSQMAVLVQQLVPADTAAVVFTANAVTGNRDEIVINANWGLGESIVSGAVTPDTFILRKSDLTVTERRIASKEQMTVLAPIGVCTATVPRFMRREPCLSDGQVRRMAQLGLALEERMERPVDVECAHYDGDLYLLQCRVVTGL